MTDEEFDLILKNGTLDEVAQAAAVLLWAGSDRPAGLVNFISAIMERAFEDGKKAGCISQQAPDFYPVLRH